MKKDKLLAATIALGLLITPVATTWAQDGQTGYVPKPVYNEKGEVIGTTRSAVHQQAPSADELKLPAGYYILDVKEGDVTGDGIADKVYLTGHKQSTASPYSDDIKIAVKNGASNLIDKGGMDKLGGYEAKLFLGDFTGDKVADVFVEAASGGSGGWYYHEIITFAGGEQKLIFDNDTNKGANVAGKFIDGFKAEISSGDNGKTATIDVSERKADYLRLGIYDEQGTVKKSTRTLATPFGKLEPVDINKDGVYELKGHQRLSGAYNADGLADIESVIRYDGNGWQAQTVKVAVNLVNLPAAKPLPAPVPARAAERRVMETESAKVYYPVFTNMDSFITMGIVNSEIEKAALKYGLQREPGAKTSLDYQITRQDKDMVSVIFTGCQLWEGGKYDILQAVNIDLNERKVVNAANLFKTDKAAKEGLTALLQEAAANNPKAAKAPPFGDWMGVYFTETDVVFYYMENDFAQEHTKLTVPIAKVKQYMN